MVTHSMQPWRMVGRDRELQLLEDLLDGVHQRGQTLLLRGEAGIGKSCLLAAASSAATERGFQVLSTTGVQSESHLPFAGLHQLLRPILARVEDLPGPQRAAMRAAFGISDLAAPEFFFIALAVLDLLADVAAQAPLLLVIEDVQWLDRPTLDVVTFVARRLESEPTIVLATARVGPNADRSESEFPELLVEPLHDEAARTLLDGHAPDLAPSVRERILADAGGNPLALVELPTAWRAGAGGEPVVLPAVLPLTARLERAFAARMSELAEPARTVLLAAAIDDGDGDLGEVVAVAELVEGAPIGPEAVESAVTAGLVENDGLRVRFRHPLVRSAIYHATELPRRRIVHASWATVLAEQPDRWVWHQAAASIRADESLAVALEETAARAQRRGAMTMAIAALERAARLTPDPTRQGARLLSAAELAFEIGRRDIVGRLLREAGRLELGLQERSRVAFLQGVFDDGTPGDAAGMQSLLDLAEWAGERGDTELTVRLLTGAARRCWWGDPGPGMRAVVVTAGERLDLPTDDPRLLAILGLSDPIGHGRTVMDQARRRIESGSVDVRDTLMYGQCLYVAGDFAWAQQVGLDAIGQLRGHGRLALLAQALVLRALAGLYLGDWAEARTSAEEAGRLARETDQPIWAVTATIAEVVVAGLRSEPEDAAALDEVEAWAVGPAAFGSVLAGVQTARGLIALGAGRPEAAFHHLRRVLDPADPAYHYMQRCHVIGFLAEAAVLSGEQAAAREVVTGLEEAAALTPSPMLQQGMAYARAVLAENDQAEALFRKALSDPELPQWPFPQARLTLAYGSWLRRQRRVAESREPLRSARDQFDALGGMQWGDRARQELRAAGEASRRRRPGARDRLSPQELQIARMAAEGLSNREIGQRLYLSHRTVGSHLYRIFPKLEVTARSQLRTALEP
jgi:DNA-binding CsgD family transcriptional regulator